MRPRATNPDLEIIVDETVRVAGQLDDSDGKVDYDAAEHAMARAVDRGLFAKQAESRFAFAYYWETLDGMQAYIDETWADNTILPPEVVQRARELTPAGQAVQFRARESVVIAAYRKRPP
jgi:hypothetical protein